MYCVNCGVKLADSEKKCPLCNTEVVLPKQIIEEEQYLYPRNKTPKIIPNSKVLGGALIIIFMLPLILAFFSDYNDNKQLDWFWLVLGGMLVLYVSVALPFWFRKPNPVIFVPCDFAALAVYLLYINYLTGGNWYWSFALPVTASVCVVTCTLITLLRYCKKGRLFTIGGCIIGFGLLVFMIEVLMMKAFELEFKGWSMYPLATLAFTGLFLLYLAINKSARAMIERKLFF